MRGYWGGLALAAVVVVGIAHAESAQMRGKFPAGVREAGRLEFVAVDRFDGRDGRQVETLLEQAIGVPGGQPDGVLTGGVTTGVEENPYKGSVERCVEWKDGDRSKECTKRAQVPVPCTRRVVVVTVSVRLIRTDTRLSVYSDNKSGRSETSWCEGGSPSIAVEQMVSAQIRDIASRIRADVRPSVQNYSVRFREDRDGMPKDLGNQFKAIVKLSKSDARGACQQWAALDGQMPNNASVLYNLAVCAEAAGAYPDALTRYRAAHEANPRKKDDVSDSIDRVDRLMLARADDEEIARRRSGRR
ncbi:MAG: tetratricopeptide repeat protein [Sphingomonas sp.]|uniref:hypothetical protein n=1 Tax=Sphingomonas sp. TaxID=28214 RepID=UPI00121460B6|nr:hypothetical protein [Sphingomonas sp.]THD35269.1 MAG: tetratricopeptide repeat protein [Sphingomonas sp.]